MSVNKKIAEKLEEKIGETFEEIKVEDNNSKSIFCITSVKDDRKGIIYTSQITQGKKIDIVQSIVFLLKQDENLDIHEIFEAVKDSI